MEHLTVGLMVTYFSVSAVGVGAVVGILLQEWAWWRHDLASLPQLPRAQVRKR